MNVMCSCWHLLGEAKGCRRASGDDGGAVPRVRAVREAERKVTM